MTALPAECIGAIKKIDRYLKSTNLKEKERIVYLLKVLLLKKNSGTSSDTERITWGEIQKSALDRSPHTGKRLDLAFTQLDSRIPGLQPVLSVSPVFTSPNLNDPHQINNKIVKAFSSIPVDNDLLTGELADYCIRMDPSLNRKYGFDFYPSSVSRLIAGLIDLKPGMRICDMNARDGTNLIACIKGKVGTGENGGDIDLYGFCRDDHETAICLLNLALHNIPLARAHVIVSKYGSRYSLMVERIAPCHRILGEYSPAFIPTSMRRKAHESINDLIQLLTLDGMLASVVPQRVLASPEYADARVEFVKDDKLELVLRLPESFSAYSGMELYLLILRRQKSPYSKDRVLFVDLADAFRYNQDPSIRSRLLDETIEKYWNFANGILDRKEPVLDQFSCPVGTDVIEKTNYILAIQRYVYPRIEHIDIEETYLDLQLAANRKRELIESMDSYLKDIVVRMK